MNISIESFCLTVPKKFVGEPFSVSLFSGIEKCYASEGYVTILCLSKIFVSVPKNFVGEPFCAVFQKCFGSEKVYRYEGVGVSRFCVDTGAACSIIYDRTFLENAQFRHTITVVKSKQKTKTSTVDIVPMIGHTTLPFRFDSDGEHQFELRIGITETQTSSLLGIEFCRRCVYKLHYEIPAIEPKNTANAICYGNMCSTKPYAFVSKIHTTRTPHQIQIYVKTSRVWKYLSEDKSESFPPETTFVPHRQSAKSGPDFF